MSAVRAERETPVTEAEWLACTYPHKMLAFLRGRASDRKLWLFVAVCARTSRLVFGDEQVAVGDAYERQADGLASEEVVIRVLLGRMFDYLCPEGVVPPAQKNRPAIEAAVTAAKTAVDFTLRDTRGNIVSDRASIAVFLHDIFGNPFRPVALDPAWLTWHAGTIPKLAQAIYDDRDLPSGHLDPHHLAVLADALEDAGCDDHDILGHCRGPGPHVRGCWVVDLLLGKE
jgi:hypothetical protein